MWFGFYKKLPPLFKSKTLKTISQILLILLQCKGLNRFYYKPFIIKKLSQIRQERKGQARGGIT